VKVIAAAGASPRLALLRSLIPLERALSNALRAVGVLAVRRIAVPPQPVKAGGVVRKLAYELHERVVRIRRLGSLGLVSVHWWHGYVS
jgi:hypothetical protein